MKGSTKDAFLYEEDRPPIASKPDSKADDHQRISANGDERSLRLSLFPYLCTSSEK